MNDNKNCCKASKPAHYNEGIHCNVKNCMYHDCDCYCTASMINVGPSNATSSTETVCATFKERK